jgi:large subunit ribosomal protein L17
MAKAKAIRGAVEKLITKAKRGTNADLNIVRGALADKKAEAVLLSDAKSRFTARTSGYTRIVKLGVRRGDATEEVFLSLVDQRAETPVEKKEAPKAKLQKEATKKVTAKKAVAKKK